MNTFLSPLRSFSKNRGCFYVINWNKLFINRVGNKTKEIP